MNNQELLRKLLKAVAKDNFLTLIEVERILKAPYEFQAMIMKTKCNREELDFPTVRVPFWGLFHCADYTKDRLKRLNKRHVRDNHRQPNRKNDRVIS